MLVRRPLPRRLPAPRLPSSLRALRHRDYRRWAAAGTVSVVGTWLQTATQAWLLLQLSGSGAMLGAGVALNALPSLLLGPWAGVLADRFSRRNLLLGTQGSFAVLALAHAVGAAADVLTVNGLLVLSLVTGLVAVVDAPAGGALGASLVPEEDLANAMALGSATNSLGRILGMSLAGVVIALTGPGFAFGLNVLSCLPVLFVLWRFPRFAAVASERTERPAAALRAGLRFVADTPQLVWMLGLAFVLGSLGRSYQVTMAIMVDDVLGGGAGAYGVASTAFAVGALIGAVAAAHLGQVTGKVVVLAGLVGAVGQVTSGIAPSLVVFAGLMVGVAAAAVVLDTAVSTRVMTTAPDSLRGRVLAVAGAAGAGAGALGGPALGGISELFGGRAPLLIGGAICLTALAVAHRPVMVEGVAEAVGVVEDVVESTPRSTELEPVFSGVPTRQVSFDEPTEQVPALALA